MFIETTAYFENTTMREIRSDSTNELLGYDIAPVEGYVLNDNRTYGIRTNPETGEDEEYPMYCSGSLSVWKNYNFETNPYDIYAVPRNEVPENSIYGHIGNDNKPERM